GKREAKRGGMAAPANISAGGATSSRAPRCVILTERIGLLWFDAGLGDHIPPFPDVGPNLRSERVRRARIGGQALLGQRFLHVGGGGDVARLLVQLRG